MNNTYNITNKSEAYEYLYDVINGLTENEQELTQQAHSFFTETELLGTSFAPLHVIDECFPGFAEKCACTCANEHKE